MKIGEIIETSTTEYVAQAYSYDAAPAFGSFVCSSADGTAIIGVVIEVLTSTIDTSRRPIALGTSKTTLKDTLSEHPQLERLIHTYFKVRITHSNGQETTPSKPAHLHEGVESCDAATAKKLLGSVRYMSNLLPLPDDVLAKHLAYLGTIDEAAQIAASQQVTRLLKDDYQRLSRILREVI